MRIGIFTDTYPPFINGVSTSITMLKGALEKLGHEVFVVTVNNENMKYKYEDNGKVIRIPGVRTGIYEYRLTGVYPVRVLNKIKKWNLDVIHSHTEFGIGGFARFFAKQYNIPLVHTYHTMYEDHIEYITHGHFKKASDEFVKYVSLFFCDKTADELIVPTKKTYDIFKDKYKLEKNINIIPTGIEIDRFKKENIDKKILKLLKDKYKINKDDFTIVYVGRIGKEKNIEYVIDVLKEVSKKHSNIKMLFVGYGPDTEPLKELAKSYNLLDKLTFVGKVAWEDVPLYYNLGNVFITASTTETQGLTTIEAMAAGCVPVCINDDAFNKVIVDSENGKIFNTKKECVEIINKLIEDKNYYNNLAINCSKSSEKYSSRYYAESALKVYEHAIENKKGRFGLTSEIIKRVRNK